jgi:gluconate:H+ symporter, GntP family
MKAPHRRVSTARKAESFREGTPARPFSFGAGPVSRGGGSRFFALSSALSQLRSVAVFSSPLFLAVSTTWPFVVLVTCLMAIVFLISVARVHAFFALICAALLAGVLAERLPGEYGTLPDAPEKERSHWVQAAELTAEGFGNIAGKIGIAIALAAVIGTCLVESGAAEKVVRRFLAIFGEKRAAFALLCSSYVLSIPLFFDTFFMLLLPLARALRVRTGRDYMLYVLAICCGGTVTHSLVAPHPGPLAMAENLHLELGLTIVIGILVGVPAALAGWAVARWAARRLDAPMRETGGISTADLEEMGVRREEELPSLAWSLAPVLTPIVLIAGASFAGVFGAEQWAPRVFAVLGFVGHRIFALVLGAALAVWLVMRQRGWTMARVTSAISEPFATAAVIILISAAGGAFGAMLKHAGVGDAIKALAAGREVNLIVLAWMVSAVIRAAQGSATVAMITTSSMVYPMISAPGALPYHPIYIFLAIGFGSKFLSWMNDSGFWTVSKLSGFTEKETLQSWTLIVTAIAVTGLFLTLGLATVFPARP